MDGKWDAAVRTAIGDELLTPTRSRNLNASTWLASFAIAGLIAAPFYYGATLSRNGASWYESDQLVHMLALCACNWCVVVAALSANGQSRFRITKVWNTALFFHGALALATLGARLFFSRSLMIVSFCLSLLFGLLAVAARYKSKGLRVAVLAPDGPPSFALRSLGEVIADRGRDLRGYDVVLLNLHEPLEAEWARAVSRAVLSGAQVRHAAEYLEEVRGQTSIEHFHVDHVSDQRVALYAAGKRIMEVALVIFFMPAILLLLALGMGAVLICDGRPVFFVQDRVGLGGRSFRMYKLRTMRAPKFDEKGGATTDRDPRITPVGRFLRKYRIDELPQVWNVLRGDMSLIGPRPEWSVLAEGYARELAPYSFRHLVRPGITGWAQIKSGHANDLNETRIKLSYDLFYVKYFSLALDIQILLRTVIILLGGAGAR